MLFLAAGAQAQTYFPASVMDYTNRINPASNISFNSTSAKKWSINKYSGLSTSFSFFSGGHATIVSAPFGVQLNRRLNNNLYAFAGASVAPSYINFRSSIMNQGLQKVNGNTFDATSFGLYSRAELGLMYVNDGRTFSISGSIGIEKYSSTPSFGQPDRTNANNNLIFYKK